MNKKIIITGASGMIGLHLIDLAIKNNDIVYAVVRSSSLRIDRIPSHNNVHIVKCDLCDIEKLPEYITEKCDLFYHLAWDGTFGNDRNNLMAQVLNIEYSLKAVRVANALGCEMFLGAGSQAEFGRSNESLNQTVPCFPENGYGIAKLCTGNITRLECEKLGMRHIWVRILSIYGPYDGDRTLISTLISKFKNNEPVDTTYGEQIWDYMYVKDCVKALYLLGIKGIHGKIYCVGSGNGIPLREYVEMVKKLTKSSSEIRFGSIPYSKNQVMHLVADISDLKNDVSFECEYSFEEGIRETIDFYK